jgi:hypothetical protein
VPSNLLLLTATIKPPAGVPNLRLTDPRQRLKDYIHALKFYCKLPRSVVAKVVFVENSASDLSPLEEAVAKANASEFVEFVSFDGLNYPSQYGRAYGELKLVDYGVQHSTAIGGAKPTDVLWKVTGRYRILNIASLIRSAPANFDLYCDLRDWPTRWMDMRIFACTVSAHQALLKDMYTRLREDVIKVAPEQHMHPLIEELAKSDRVVTRFRREPRVDGTRGTDLKHFLTTDGLVKYHLRSSFRHAARFLPIHVRI